LPACDSQLSYSLLSRSHRACAPPAWHGTETRCSDFFLSQSVSPSAAQKVRELTKSPLSVVRRRKLQRSRPPRFLCTFVRPTGFDKNEDAASPPAPHPTPTTPHPNSATPAPEPHPKTAHARTPSRTHGDPPWGRRGSPHTSRTRTHTSRDGLGPHLSVITELLNNDDDGVAAAPQRPP
jgi:hypothetical protein